MDSSAILWIVNFNFSIDCPERPIIISHEIFLNPILWAEFIIFSAFSHECIRPRNLSSSL